MGSSRVNLSFVAEEICNGFAAADEFGGFADYQYFGGTRAGVVVGGQRHAVGAGVENGEQGAFGNGRQFAITGKEVTGLADGTDDIHDFGNQFLFLIYFYRHNLVVSAIE